MVLGDLTGLCTYVLCIAHIQSCGHVSKYTLSHIQYMQKYSKSEITLSSVTNGERKVLEDVL